MENTRLSTKEMWERTYDARTFTPSYASPETRCGTYELVRVFRRFLPPTPGSRLLEMGCGGSKYLPWFAREMRYVVEGIDYTFAGCQSARKNLEAAGVQGHIHCEDFLALPDRFRSNFDVVTSFGVVEHFANPSEVLRAFGRCLKPNGLLVTFVPNMKGLPGHLIRKIDRPLFDTHHLFDLDEFKSFHRQAGLAVVYGRYSEWLDLALLPLARLGGTADLVLKNFVYYINRIRLLGMKRFPSFDPQSKFLCSGMIVIAAKR